MWKPEHRLAADRRGLRYPSDLTDAEWAIVAAMIPPGRHGGRRRSVNVREVLNGIFYVLWTGCQWKAHWDGTLERIHHALYVAVREEEGVKQARRWRSSTRRPRRALKKGVLA